MTVKTGFTFNNSAAIPVATPKIEDPRTVRLFSQGISLIAANTAIAEPTRNVKKAEKIEKKLQPIARDIEKVRSFLADLKNPTIPDSVLSGHWNFSLELQSVIKRCLALIPNSNQPRILLQMKNAQGENILESYIAQTTAKFEALRELAALYRSGAQDAHKIGTLQIEKQKAFQFTLSHVLAEALSETDTEATSVEILKLHQLQDFYTFLHSPQCSNEFIYEKFQKLDFEIKTALGEAVWTACYSPDEPFFTDHLIAKNPRILLECINRDGVDVIIQLMDHYKAKVELQRFKKEFASFAERFKKNPKSATFQNSLPKFAREDIANLVWMEHGAKHNPKFGYWRYGEIQIEKNPQVLTRKDHDGKSILEIYAKLLEGKIAYDIRQGAKQFAKEMQLPNEPIDCSVKKCSEKIPENTRIAMVTAEYAGVISMGGLAPAVAGMTRAHGTKNARVILPKYDVINPKLVLKEKDKYLIKAHGTTYKVYKTNVGGVKCYLIEDPLFNVGFNKEGKPNNIYEGRDVDTKRRFAHFSSLSAELVNKMSRKAKNPVELVHVHDAQTALVPKILMSRHYSDWKAGKTPATVFTFHNNNTPLTYDYPEVQNHLAEIGLPWRPLNAFIDGMESSDMNTTVSKSFAEEVQTALHGKGMQKYVKIHAASGKLAGIVNGNTEGWNPKTDVQLKNWITEDGVALDLTYSPDDKDLDQKKLLIRQQLVEYLHNHKLAKIDPKKPIFFYVGRYDAYQKGIDKLPIIMDEALKNDAQFICIGLDPDPKADGILKEMEEIAKKRGNKGVCVIRDFKRSSDGRLHWQQGNTKEDKSGVQGFGSLLRAAVDLGIFPSIFEPCGLVQGEMHNMGIETIATEIGGFKDTIFTSGPNRNGYLFERHPQWESEEQNKAIRAVVREAAFAQHAKLEALYSGNQTESERFTKRSRTIMSNAAKSTWTSTFDGSPSPKEQIQHAYGKALKNRKKRGKIHLDIHGLKKA
jgi:starch synthase